MILANITFGTKGQNDSSKLEDLAESYLATLFGSGQLLHGDSYLTWTKGRLNSHVILAGREACEMRYHSKYGKTMLKQIIRIFGKAPGWKIIDDEANKPSPTLKSVPFIYLFTTALNWASPLCRGDGKFRIPAFKLPLTHEQKERLYCWQRSYQLHDNLWLDSGALEIQAYRQLADIDSELTKEGRELCQIVETATKVPTFYYLMRYWGRPKAEENRLCPGCGREWRTIPAETSLKKFWLFDFKCDECRLVSHIGVSFDGGRHARIGEFKAKLKAKTR